MTFKVVGRYAGRVREVVWTDGELSGDELLITHIKAEAQAAEHAGRPFGLPTGPASARADEILGSHQIAVYLISGIMEEVISSTWRNPEPFEDDGHTVQ